MSTEKRRHHTPEQKLAVQREHLLDRKPISEILIRRRRAPRTRRGGCALA